MFQQPILESQLLLKNLKNGRRRERTREREDIARSGCGRPMKRNGKKSLKREKREDGKGNRKRIGYMIWDSH